MVGRDMGGWTCSPTALVKPHPASQIRAVGAGRRIATTCDGYRNSGSRGWHGARVLQNLYLVPTAQTVGG